MNPCPPSKIPNKFLTPKNESVPAVKAPHKFLTPKNESVAASKSPPEISGTAESRPAEIFIINEFRPTNRLGATPLFLGRPETLCSSLFNNEVFSSAAVPTPSVLSPANRRSARDRTVMTRLGRDPARRWAAAVRPIHCFVRQSIRCCVELAVGVLDANVDAQAPQLAQ